MQVVSKQKKETELELEYIENLILSVNSATDLLTLEDINLEIIEKFNIHSQKLNAKNIKETKDAPLKYKINGFDVFARKKQCSK